jgi:putative transposase
MAAVSGPFHAQPVRSSAQRPRRNGRRNRPHRTRPARPGIDQRPAAVAADMLRDRHTAVSALLHDAAAYVIAYVGFPRAHWKKIWSTNPLERLMREIKRRADVVGIFPDDPSILRLVGPVLAEQHDEWHLTNRRYLGEESMAFINTIRQYHPDKEVNRHQLPAG